MDVGTIASLSSQTVAAASTPKQTSAPKAEATEEKAGANAYQVNVSKDGAAESAAGAQNKAIKGLTKEQTQILQAGIDSGYQKMLQSMAGAVTSGNILAQGALSANGGSKVNSAYDLMINVLTAHNDQLQGYVNDGVGILNFGGTKIDASKFVLPSVGTTPEEAAAAISDGGDWSVNAVSDRIFGLASAIAGNDPEKLKAMQDAVEKGFQQAGVTWKDAMGEDKMPKITQDTHAEITRRFEEAYKKLGTNTQTTDTTNATNTANTAASTKAASKTTL